MSNTRKAKPGAELRQERWCSDSTFERGLIGNLVAVRVAALTYPEERELAFFLQYLSHQTGGLAALVNELLERFPERFATAAMRRFGCRAGQIYNASKFKAVREEIEWHGDEFMLDGETPRSDPWSTEDFIRDDDEKPRVKVSYPRSYPAAHFVEHCQNAARNGLERLLMELCLNPKMSVRDFKPWFCPELIDLLREYRAEHARRTLANVVETEISRRIFSALDYALEGNCMVLVQGLERRGKSFSARAWCEARPGRARFVQVPSSGDDTAFFRAIAEALGVRSSLQLKCVEMRAHVETMLQHSKLMLVLDDAHLCWPQSSRDVALPKRIIWIMTALVNHNVPVALVATPQFIADQKFVEKKTRWRSGQFVGRTHYEPLPDELSEQDRCAVARAHFPEGDGESIKLLARCAKFSLSYLAAIPQIVQRARFEAKRAGQKNVTFQDLKRVVEERTLPSDNALNKALDLATKPPPARRASLPQPPRPIPPTPYPRSRLTPFPASELVASLED